MARNVIKSIVCTVTIASLLTGCAHHSHVAPAPYGDPPPVYVEDNRGPLERINEFCAWNEWVCIVGGLLVFGGTVAAIKSSED